MRKIKKDEMATILAALRYYQESMVKYGGTEPK